jgi:tetratricopeptide (TPR) repeat protein
MGLPRHLLCCCFPLLVACGGSGPDPEIAQAYALMGIQRERNDPPGLLLSSQLPPPPAGPGEHQARIEGYRQAEALIAAEETERPGALDVLVARGVHSVQLVREPMQMDVERRHQLGELAQRSFEQAAALDPDDRDASWGLLMVHMTSDCLDGPSCEAAADGVLRWNPDDVLARYAMSRALFIQQRYDEAIPWMQALIDDPAFEQDVEHRAFTLNNLATIHQQRGDQQALDALRARADGMVGELQGQEGAYYRGCPYQALGALYRVAGSDEQAAALERQANLVDLEPLLAGLSEAVTSMQRGDLAAASARLPRLPSDVAENKAGEPLYLSLASRTLFLQALLLAAEQRWEGASDAVDAGARALAGLPLERVARGHIALGRQEPLVAGEHFEAALSLPAPDPLEGEGAEIAASCDALGLRMARLGLAWIAANQAEYPAAMAYYDEALAASPGDRLARQGKAVAHIALGELDQAQALLEGLLEEWPQDPYARAELGIVHLNRGDLGGARESFERAMTDGGPSYSCPYEGLGLVMLRQGNAQGASDMLEQAIQMNPDLEYKKYNALARIRIEAGETEAARALLRKSIENFPYDDEAQRLLDELEATPAPGPAP